MGKLDDVLDKTEEIPFIAEVIQGGRITIPEEVRNIFEIKEGYFVLCRIKVISRRRKETRTEKVNGKK